jgi:DNA (cytosine-5)-methyltransferase 1
VRLSIEKDLIARNTLKLRKFFHQFPEPPDAYQSLVKGELTQGDLFRLYPKQSASAESRAWQAELGNVNPRILSRRVRLALGSAKHWVLLGGPPCQAYSVVGRSRMRSTHEHFERDERHFLYREYLRLVANHRPSAFVFENVKGLLSSTQDGVNVFAKILADLASPATALRMPTRRALSYRLYALGPSAQLDLFTQNGKTRTAPDFLVLSEQHGIPQSRHRIIVLGVRSDVAGMPLPLELRSTIDTGHVLDDLPAIRSRLSQEPDSLVAWLDALRHIAHQQWYQDSGHAMFGPVSAEMKRVVRNQCSSSLEPGGAYCQYARKPSALANWYRRGATGLSLHEARQHRRDDLHRYFYAACFLRVHERSPKMKDFPEELRPDHKNIALAISGQMFNDRFRVQLPNAPSTTITSHISKDGHYFIHYSPDQCRSFTVREAARLQTFPDSYFFSGTRTDQYHQVGNAVPPYLAMQIAGSIFNLLKQGR